MNWAGVESYLELDQKLTAESVTEEHLTRTVEESKVKVYKADGAAKAESERAAQSGNS